MRRIIAVSDLHGHLPMIPPCDLLLIAGDICPGGNLLSQAKWLDINFRAWLKTIPAKEIVMIAGNHDMIFERAPESVPTNLSCHYLQDNKIELLGLKIYGTPWQKPFWGAFNLNEPELEKKYQCIPGAIDILISHGPPFGIGDEVSGQHVGSKALREKIFEIKPKLIVFGHIHDAFGQWQINEMTFANVSLLNDAMEVVNKPIVFDRIKAND